MSYRRRHRWFRRMALGLAFSLAVFAGRASVAAAKFDEGTDGARYVAAGGWSGLVDMETGVPLSAGIPKGDEQFIDEQAVQVIPYLSGGILTEADAQAAAAQTIHDPYLTDVFVRPGESLGGPDGDSIAIRNALETQTLTVAEAIHDPYLTEGDSIAIRNALETQTLAVAEAIHDPYLTDLFVRPGESLGGPDGGEIAFANAVVAAADSLHDPLTAQEQSSTQATFVPGVTDFPKAAQSVPDNRVERALEQGPQVIPYLSHGMTADDVVGVRPDDQANRFVPSDVPSQQPELASSSGSTIEWNEALTVGIGALALVLGLGLALGYLRRPRIAGL